LNENKTTRASDALTTAHTVLAFLILAYFCYLISAALLLPQLFGPSITREERPQIFIFQQSAFYLWLAFTIVPQAWYLYRGIRRKLGSEGPGVGVGVIAPTAVGYVLLVLGPFLGIYNDIIDSSFVLLISLVSLFNGLFLVGPAYILLFYFFVVRS
jgi:hypothetical protein